MVKSKLDNIIYNISSILVVILILSKQLTRPPDQYKNPQPHVELAKRLQRTLPPTQAPKTGDRIDYIIRPGGEKTCMRAMLPQEVTDGICGIDNKWYLENQQKEPLKRVFDMVINNTQDIFKVDKIRAPNVGTSSIFSSWMGKRSRAEDKTANNIPIKKRKPGENTKKSLKLKDFFK